jgi:sugar phosphate isomerase/epimerase
MPAARRDEELGWAAETIAAAAETIPAGGPVLALEALNRYETHLIRTLDDAEELRAAIGHPQVRLMADLFHMQLEEDDTPAALRAHAGEIAHVHLADSQRREPGSGQLDLAGALAALATEGYGGALAMEFLPATDAALRAGREHVEGLLAAAGRRDAAADSDGPAHERP